MFSVDSSLDLKLKIFDRHGMGPKECLAMYPLVICDCPCCVSNSKRLTEDMMLQLSEPAK